MHSEQLGAEEGILELSEEAREGDVSAHQHSRPVVGEQFPLAEHDGLHLEVLVLEGLVLCRAHLHDARLLVVQISAQLKLLQVVEALLQVEVLLALEDEVAG